MNVAFDATPLCRNVSGVGRYTHNLITTYALNNPDTTVYLLCFSGDTINHAYSLQPKNIRIHKIPLPRKAYQFMYRRFFRIPCDIFIRSLQLDAIVCPNFTIFPYVKKTPSIVVIHDLAYVRYPKTIEPKNLRYLSKHVPLAIKQATRIAAVSEFTRSELCDVYGIKKDDVSVINCGIDSSCFNGGLKKRQPSILAVGTVEPRKNLKNLIAAYEKLPKKVQSHYGLKIVGANGWGDGHGGVKNKNIEILGYVSDGELRRLYGSASLLAFPSIYEGFGLPILEAFSSNTPVVCSDIPPFREIAGKNATYFDPQDVDNIAKKLLVALATKSKQTVDYQKIAEQWSWQRSATQLSKLIESL